MGEPELAAVKAAGRRRVRRERRLRLGVGAAAAVLALVGVAGVVNQQGSTGPRLTAGPPDASAQLSSVEWQLQSLTVSDVAQDIPDDRAVLRFDGDGGYTGTVCNHFGGGVTVDDGTLRFSSGATTLIGCTGVIADIERHIGRLLAGQVSWSLRDRTLRLEARDIVAVFVDGGTAFPTHDLHVLATDTGERGEYQFGYHSGEGVLALRWEGRARAGQPWGSAEFAVTGPIGLQAVGEGARRFVFGYMPPGAVRAEYQVEDQKPTALETAPLPNGSSAFWGFVAAPGGEVAAFDGGGREVARSRRAPAS